MFADADHTVDLVDADADDARHLGCAEGSPLFRERRRVTDPASTPLLWSDDRFLPGTVSFTVHNSVATRPCPAAVASLGGCASLPQLRLSLPVLQHNVELMATWCRDRGVELCPHIKTTMTRPIVERQMRAGAWGVTVATVRQAPLPSNGGRGASSSPTR